MWGNIQAVFGSSGSDVQARLKDVHSVHGSNIAMAAIVGTGWTGKNMGGKRVTAIAAMVEGPWQTTP